MSLFTPRETEAQRKQWAPLSKPLERECSGEHVPAPTAHGASEQSLTETLDPGCFLSENL